MWPEGIVSLPTGRLLVTSFVLDTIFLFDPITGGSALVAGRLGSGYEDGTGSKARFCGVRGMVLIERERLLYVCDVANSRVRMLTLPPALFDPAHEL